MNALSIASVIPRLLPAAGNMLRVLPATAAPDVYSSCMRDPDQLVQLRRPFHKPGNQ
jgi:hypothetical protein